MDGEDSVEGILREVLAKVEPSEEERRRVHAFVEALTAELNSRLSGAGIDGSAEIHGSVAKDTWLSGDRDLDIFIVLKKTYDRSIFPRVLDVVKELVGTGWVEAYAEHPYLQAEIEGFKVDFVPCFEMDAAGRPLSATDRTPLHTAFVREHLKGEARKEVLLLKQFMHGIGTYGAEVKVGGFSGYLCELLVIHHGSFLGTLRAASRWKKNTVLDTVGHYRGREGELRKLGDHLIVVDPVDERRNVASAVVESKLWLFAVASREFLRAPHLGFFFPPETRAYGEVELERAMEECGSDMVFLLLLAGRQRVPDVLWGQLYRAEKALRELLEEHDFKVLRTAVWSDERVNHIFVFEVERSILPRIKLHRGPPVEMEEMSERFLRKHRESRNAITGPWVEGDRWWVEVERDYTEAGALLEDKLREKGGIPVGVPRSMAEDISGFLCRVNEEITDLYRQFPSFAVFLTDFLRGRPKWLRLSFS
jgi:tRNA nucleotidyltransferase (CCA-adding enzyme)